MPDDLVIHLNRSERHAIEPAESSLAVAVSFEVAIENHGDGSHVNLSLGGDLAAGGAVGTPSPFVPAGETVRLMVAITTEHRPLEGTLSVATGYGRTQIELPVSVVTPQNTGVDADPTPTRSNGGQSVAADPMEIVAELEETLDPGTTALVLLAAIALVIALVAAWQVGGSVVFLAVVLVVLAVGGGIATVIR